MLSAEALDRMRAIGLRLDGRGRFWHEQHPVTHARLHLALLRWMDVLPDGRTIVRLDEQRFAYLDVEDTHLRARTARWDGDRCWITWDDEHDEELPYSQLSIASDHALLCPARSGRLRGRIAGSAYHTVVSRVEPRGEGFALIANGTMFPIVG